MTVFTVKVDPDWANDFETWCDLMGYAAHDLWRHDAPYLRATLYEVRVADDQADEFAELWSDDVVSVGLTWG